MAGEVKKVLDDFGQYVVSEAKQNLMHDDKNDTGKLIDTLKYTAKESKNSFEFSIEMESYGKFVDKGVKGKVSSSKAPSSPFRFGTGTGEKGGLTRAIDGWVQRKRIQFRDKGGKFLSYKSTAFLITRSIYTTGLKTTNFLTKPFEEAFKELPDNITEKYGLELDKFLKQQMK